MSPRPLYPLDRFRRPPAAARPRDAGGVQRARDLGQGEATPAQLGDPLAVPIREPFGARGLGGVGGGGAPRSATTGAARALASALSRATSCRSAAIRRACAARVRSAGSCRIAASLASSLPVISRCRSRSALAVASIALNDSM